MIFFSVTKTSRFLRPHWCLGFRQTQIAFDMYRWKRPPSGFVDLYSEVNEPGDPFTSHFQRLQLWWRRRWFSRRWTAAAAVDSGGGRRQAALDGGGLQINGYTVPRDRKERIIQPRPTSRILQVLCLLTRYSWVNTNIHSQSRSDCEWVYNMI